MVRAIALQTMVVLAVLADKVVAAVRLRAVLAAGPHLLAMEWWAMNAKA